MTPSNKQRSRRLRKKLHVGEFKQYGFHFEAELAPGVGPAAEEALVDVFLEEVVEARNLALGGWATGGFIAHYYAGSATDEDRQAVESWLSKRPEIKSVKFSPLVDAWHLPT